MSPSFLSSSPSLISFFGANYIWTTLHDFGGTDGMKGNMSQINEIPFAGMSPERDTSVWGTGFTPEGIDQVRARSTNIGKMVIIINRIQNKKYDLNGQSTTFKFPC